MANVLIVAAWAFKFALLLELLAMSKRTPIRQKAVLLKDQMINQVPLLQHKIANKLMKLWLFNRQTVMFVLLFQEESKICAFLQPAANGYRPPALDSEQLIATILLLIQGKYASNCHFRPTRRMGRIPSVLIAAFIRIPKDVLSSLFAIGQQQILASVWGLQDRV